MLEMRRYNAAMSPSRSSPRRYRIARHISVLLPAVTRKTFGRKSFAEQQLLTRWRDMVGAEHARHSLPVRLHRGRNNQGGTLSVQAESGIALLMQHDAPRIIERINKDSGYALVARLKFIQAPLPNRDDAPPAMRHSAAPLPSTSTPPTPLNLPHIDHPPLRAALKRLGQGMRRHLQSF